MSDIDGAETVRSSFKVKYQLTDAERKRQDDLPKSVRDSDSELRKLLSEITDTRQLKQLFHPVRLNSKNVSPWRIWKGAPYGSKPGSKTVGTNMVRFILQYERVSINAVVIIAHFRSDDHDLYEKMLQRVKSGNFTVVRPRIKITENVEAPTPSIARLMQAPGSLLPNFDPHLKEGSDIPPDFERVKIKNALNRRERSHFSTTLGKVSLVPDGNGGATLLLEDEVGDVVREYPTSVLRDEESWEIVRKCAEEPDIDPCLMLSDSQRRFLEDFRSEGHLPILVNGSPGSGKTTLLTLALAALVHESSVGEKLSGAQPLFVTYSEELRDRARKRLINTLVIHREWGREKAEKAAKVSCRTFTEIVNEIIGGSVADSTNSGH